MDRRSIMTSLRMAGEVRRYHTHPVLRQQSVAEHTWQMMAIWVQIWGHMPPQVSTAILLHDTPEVQTGDIPFGIKRDHSALRLALEEIELEVHNSLTGTLWGDAIDHLTDSQRSRIKACDLLEMLEFGAHEVHMGNRHGQAIVDAISEALVMRFEMSESSDREAVMRWGNRRLQELGVVSSTGMGM